jgi:hypothetical protein
VLREFPLWAIEQACLEIARGKAGLDRRFAPNDAEIAAVVADIVAIHRIHLKDVRGLIRAHAAHKARNEAQQQENHDGR